ncbi:uncharacterized protein A4U43_C01F12550 [Asparagus officinalis]|uniref:Uncharacterized protein n=1 Tax=Asparagus officinalis TaxID=4686 RepID=A0A5P1FRC9_ASPOF|nr:uncharacterized protein A4U43_C01F12550 [Asparagus officinalis]
MIAGVLLDTVEIEGPSIIIGASAEEEIIVLTTAPLLESVPSLSELTSLLESMPPLPEWALPLESVPPPLEPVPPLLELLSPLAEKRVNKARLKLS